MKYLKYIKEEFENEFSGSDASAILLDYDAFVLNGTNSQEDEVDEVDDVKIDGMPYIRSNIKQVG